MKKLVLGLIIDKTGDGSLFDYHPIDVVEYRWGDFYAKSGEEEK